MRPTQHILTSARPGIGRRPARLLDALLLLASLAGIAAILLEYGFYVPPLPVRVDHLVQAAVAAWFATDRLVRWSMRRFTRPYLREQWRMAVLTVLAGVTVAASLLLDWQVAGRAAWLLVVQGYVLAVLVARALALAFRALDVGVAPSRLFAYSFAFLILLGSGLLMLPRAVPPGQQPLKFPDELPDALFTATSATCVTGLVVRDTGTQWSHFGQVVILGLIQTGALGIMIFGTVFVVIRGGLGLRHAAALGEMISQERLGTIVQMVRFIFVSTLAVEGLGAALLYPLWASHPDGVFWAVFHSISAFCNAGFALEADSLIPWRATWQVMVVVPGLIVLGGLGFPVLYDLARFAPAAARYRWRLWRQRIPRMPRPQVSLHSKVVLVTTAALLLLGMVVLLVIEPGRPRDRVGQGKLAEGREALEQMTDWQRLAVRLEPGVDPRTGAPREVLRDAWLPRIAQAWFTSVTARTAGFNTINMNELSNAGKLWVIFLMGVGGSPASTAGGMKTATLAILVMLVVAAMRQRGHVESFGRTVSTDTVRRAVTLATLYVGLLFVATLALSVAQHGGGRDASFIDVLFESASACGTVGLSTGLSGPGPAGASNLTLTLASKFVIIGAMFVGRVGPLTLLLSVLGSPAPARYAYPTEAVVIG